MSSPSTGRPRCHRFAWIAAAALLSAGCRDSAEPLGRTATSGVDSVRVYWESPGIETQAEPVGEIAGYLVYDGPSSGVYDNVTDVGKTLEATIELPAGTYFLSMTAYDDNGNESEFSNEVVVSIP